MAKLPSFQVDPDHPSTLTPAVHIWAIATAALDQPSLEDLAQGLAAQELAKLQALTHPLSRRNFLVSRGCLRYLLSHYSSQPRHSLGIDYGSHGKPELKPGDRDPGSDSNPWRTALQFNLSHSGNWLVIALSPGLPLGVDVEQVRPLSRLPQLCQRCLTPAEAQSVLSQPPAQADQRFLQYWTSKEAYTKALGLGLRFPLNQIELVIEPGPPVMVPVPVIIRSHPGNGSHWWVCQWQLAPNYLAALAVKLRSPGLEPPPLILHRTTPARLATLERTRSVPPWGTGAGA
ncbi:MAG: 4'-phosphopantetheinyl transferase family protein [Nodosilinea sp.]